MAEHDQTMNELNTVKKSIPHVPPRIDAEYYQAEVCDSVGDLPYDENEAMTLSSTNWYQSTRCTHSTDSGNQQKIQEFLIATRNIFESMRYKGESLWTGAMIDEISMESDANAIDYLASFNYDVDAALFQMFIDLGCGKEFVQSHRNYELVERYPILSNFTETKDRLFRTSKTMLGAYEVSESRAIFQSSGTYSHSSKVDPMIMLDDKNVKVEPSDVISRNYSGIVFPRKVEVENSIGAFVSTATTGKKNIDKELSDEESEVPPSTLISAKPSRDIMGKDKNECKKRWQLLHKRAAKISPKNQGQGTSKNDDRAGIIEAQEILDEAAALPMYMNAPGENFTESIRSVLNEVLVGVMATREWIARVHDLLYNAKKEFKFTELKELLQEGREQPFSSVEEVKLKDFLKSAEILGKHARKILALAVNSNAEGSEEEKQTMVSLNSLITDLSRLPFQIKEFKQLLAFNKKITDFATQIEILHERCITCRYRKPKAGPDALRIALSEAKTLCQDAMDCPIKIPLLEPMITYVEQCEQWQQEVLSLASSNENTKESKISLRKDSQNPKPTSLKRIEALFLEGERAPFQFTKELDILRDKKAQAKVWLEKLKSSFSKTSGRSQSLRKGGGDAVTGEKIGLEEMKQILQEGEELFDDESTRTVQGRELNRAQSVVDVAEEWINRVKELITESYDGESSSSLEAMRTIQEMLSEADQMPVIMPEAQVLRMHLDILEWAAKARPILLMPDLESETTDDKRGEDVLMDCDDYKNAGSTTAATVAAKQELTKKNKPSLSSIQKLAREINKIRTSLSASTLEDFPMKPLREEAFCLSCVNKTEEWTTKLKRQMSNNVIKKGAKLSTLRKLFEEGKSIPVHLDAEMRPIRLAIAAAEEWIHQSHTMLSKIGIQCDLTRYVNVDESEKDKAKEIELTSASSNLKAKKQKGGKVAKKDEAGPDAEKDGEEIKDNTVEGVTEAKGTSNDNEPFSAMVIVKEDGDDRVTFLELRQIVNSAANISAEFEEIKAARNLLSEAEKWLNEVEEHSSKKLSKKRKPAALLEALLVKGDELSLNFDNEKKKIRDILDCTAKWNAHAEEKINQILSTGLNSVVSSYRSLILADTQALPYIPFMSTSKTLEEARQDLAADDECLDFMDRLEDHLKNSDAKNVKTPDANVAQQEEVLWSRVCVMRQELIELCNEGEELGIVVSSSVLINICISAFDWVDEVRGILISRNAAAAGSANRDWGDLSKHMLDVIVTDACSLADASTWIERYSPEYKGCVLEKSITFLEYFQGGETVATNEHEHEREVSNVTEDDGGDLVRGKRKREANGWNDKDKVLKSKRRSGTKNEAGTDEKEDEVNDDKDTAEKTKKVKETKKRSKREANDDDDDQSIGEEGVEEIAVVNEVLFNEKTGQYLTSYIKYCKKESIVFPSSMEAFLDLWVRLLGVVHSRIDEVDSWSQDAKLVIDKSEAASPSATAKQCQRELMRLMNWATSRNLFMKQRRVLMSHLLKCDDWVKTCTAIKQRHADSLMEVDAFRLFVKKGEKLLLDFPEVTEMRNEWRRAKAWISKLQKTGIEKGLAKTTDLQDLVEEAKTLYADVSGNIDAIQSATKTYCLCRQAYHGEMVGCDTCDEWYHFQCIGMTKVQAEKCDKFICIKCTLKTSFMNAASIAAEATNRWMSHEDTSKFHEQKKQKLLKKKAKDEKELVTSKRTVLVMEKYMAYRLRVEGAEAPANFSLPELSDVNIEDNDLLLSSVDTIIKQQSTQDLATTVTTYRDDVNSLERRIVKYNQELEDLSNNMELETSKRSAIIEWMKAMQKVLWPTSSADLESGRPLGPEHPRDDHKLGFDRFSHNDNHYVLLPDGMCTAADAAISLEIDKVEDVITILDCFRWMSWCNISLHLIRVPPTSIAIKKIVEVTKLLRMVDDKIIKIFANILGRAGLWKTKARKLLTAKKLIDSSKLSSMVLEASTIPISCRMKDVLRTSLETTRPLSVDEPPSDSQTDGKKRKLTQDKSNLQLQSAAFINVTGDPTNSSDDEQKEGLSWSGLFRTSITGFAIAPKPDSLWPVRFTFEPKTEPTSTVMIEGGVV